MNSDFKDLLAAFKKFQVEYVVIGGYAVMFHGEPRFTKDIDIFLGVTDSNLKNFRLAMADFGIPLSEDKIKELQEPNRMMILGVPPSRIDILNEIKAVTFEEVWFKRVTADIDGVVAYFIDRESLIQTKKATGRPVDFLDVESLER